VRLVSELACQMGSEVFGPCVGKVQTLIRHRKQFGKALLAAAVCRLYNCASKRRR